MHKLVTQLHRNAFSKAKVWLAASTALTTFIWCIVPQKGLPNKLHSLLAQKGNSMPAKRQSCFEWEPEMKLEWAVSSLWFFLWTTTVLRAQFWGDLVLVKDRSYVTATRQSNVLVKRALNGGHDEYVPHSNSSCRSHTWWTKRCCRDVPAAPASTLQYQEIDQSSCVAWIFCYRI